MKKALASWTEFLGKIVSSWSGRISGGIGILLTIPALYFNNPPLRLLFVAISVLAFLVAVHTVWRKEKDESIRVRKKIEPLHGEIARLQAEMDRRHTEIERLHAEIDRHHGTIANLSRELLLEKDRRPRPRLYIEPSTPLNQYSELGFVMINKGEASAVLITSPPMKIGKYALKWMVKGVIHPNESVPVYIDIKEGDNSFSPMTDMKTIVNLVHAGQPEFYVDRELHVTCKDADSHQYMTIFNVRFDYIQDSIHVNWKELVEFSNVPNC